MMQLHKKPNVSVRDVWSYIPLIFYLELVRVYVPDCHRTFQLLNFEKD